MTLPILRDDALATDAAGFVLRLSLPWIRSLPSASLRDLEVSIDGGPSEVRVRIADRMLSDLTEESAWWFVQDRLELVGTRELAAGDHDVDVSFSLVIPYLPGGPDRPLSLPFRASRRLEHDAPIASVSRLVDGGLAGGEGTADRGPGEGAGAKAVDAREATAGEGARSDVRGRVDDSREGRGLTGPNAASLECGAAEGDSRLGAATAPGWTIAASAFNWTPDVIRAERDAADIAVGIVSRGTATTIELELGQSLRAFPAHDERSARLLGERIAGAGGSISIVGASIDEWTAAGRRRSDDERLAFLLPQLRSAHALGAAGLRLPVGQAGEPLLRRLLPTLHELDLVLYEEAQGHQTPAREEAAFDTIARIDDPHVRALIDISMLMPALPVTYLERMAASGLPPELLARLRDDWLDPATDGAVMEALREGSVPPDVHTMFMNLIVRFGRSSTADLRPILPLVGAFHLKFWDLDDTDGRVTAPIRDLGALLRGSDFAGTLCSEWGGHEWLDDDPTAMTRAHLALAEEALASTAQ